MPFLPPATSKLYLGEYNSADIPTSPMSKEITLFLLGGKSVSHIETLNSALDIPAVAIIELELTKEKSFTAPSWHCFRVSTGLDDPIFESNFQI